MAEGAGEDESADQAFRVFAVNTYLKVGGLLAYGCLCFPASPTKCRFSEHSIIAAPGKVHSVGHSGAGREQVSYCLTRRIIICEPRR